MRCLFSRTASLIALWLVGSCVVWADALIPPLSEVQAAEARKTIASFKTNPRGPFIRIRWFCRDGSTHPPDGVPCKTRGGGIQHAELSPQALKIASWNLDSGTVLAAMKFDVWFDAARDHHRLRQLVLERFLMEVDQGWVYRLASSYRGARQIEDEEKAGRALLAEMLSKPEWVDRNPFLVTQLIAAVPHGVEDGAVKKIRALAASIAATDPRFQPIRAKIHSAPGKEDLSTVERFAQDPKISETVKAQLTELVGLMRANASGRSLAARLPGLQKIAAGKAWSPEVDAFAAAFRAGKPESVFATGARLSEAIRREVGASREGRRNLELLDFQSALAERAFELSRALPGGARRARLEYLHHHLQYAFAEGLLSTRQLDALRAELSNLAAKPELPAETYSASVRYLARSVEWCRATAVRDFGPVARHWQDAEPLAKSLVDHLLRGSIALSLAFAAGPLVSDANRVMGIRHSLFGDASSQGVTAMNAGVAVGRFGIVEDEAAAQRVDPRGIYVIPETASDLKPMAGILTLDSGNALSHSQLLAANLGIPNATVPSALLPVLQKHAGQELFYAVTPRGVVILKPKSELTPAEQKLWAQQPAQGRRRFTLDTSRVRLDVKKVLSLSEVSARDSGALCGPKAANLGQLLRFFPDKVAAGLVVPFGIYYEHIRRPLGGQGKTLDQEIVEAYAESERLRDSGAEPETIRAFIAPKLARFRALIQSMPLLPDFEKELTAKLQQTFGPDGSYGLFVRSDTNAEDLPEFTGAGLNLTVPNQVGRAKILQALRDVWASPFTERAYEWRSRIMKGNERVYPSVVLLRTVPTDKSGVIATMNLETGDTREVTVNVAEGTSAVVDGGVAESLLLRPSGEVRLLQQARATYRKLAVPAGGFQNVPAAGGDTLLPPGEIAQVRAMVEEVKRKYPPEKNDRGEVLPWDIEFGFEKGQLRLFQIRPLVRFQELKTLEGLSRLETRTSSSARVSLDAVL